MYTARIRRVIATALFLLPVHAIAQRSQPLLDFLELEKATWFERIGTRRLPLAQSDFDVTFYHLVVEPDLNAPYLQGNTLCRFVATVDSLTSLRLELRREFVIDSITGNAAGFVFAGDSIAITLDHALMTGEEGSVRVYYHGVPPVANSTKGLRYTTHASGQRVIASLSTPFLAHYWWPCKDGPGDKPDSVYIDITIPDTSVAGIPVVAVSNGVLDSVVATPGKKTFQWRERYPIVPYYVMVAISNYRDFHQTFTGGQGEQFPIDYYVFDEHLTAAQQGVADLPQVMALYSEKFGAYPFAREKYGMTQLGYYGAIENQTNTIINNMGISYFGVSVHELGHMWFGDMITCRDWHHGWLNEGFASYCEALWAEHTGGFNVYKNYMQNFQWLGGGTFYLQNISDPFGIFISIIYDKGAYVLHMLRGVLGDSLFFASMSAYAADQRFRYDHATTEDFQGVCEAVSGRSLGFFFQQWVYDQYYPAYQYGYTQNAGTGETSIRILQTQQSQGRRAVFEMPVQVRFATQGGGDTTVTLWNDQQDQTFSVIVPHPITGMTFDPDGWILKSATILGVDEPVADIPLGFGMEQNYPNPFNPETSIKYTVPSPQHVSLVIYDILGREIAALVDQIQEPGTHTKQWSASGLPTGAYFCRLKTNQSVITRKMILLR